MNSMIIHHNKYTITNPKIIDIITFRARTRICTTANANAGANDDANAGANTKTNMNMVINTSTGIIMDMLLIPIRI